MIEAWVAAIAWATLFLVIGMLVIILCAPKDK